MTALRLSRLSLTASVALFFTLVAIGNITDYGANFAFVGHVLSMDTTFRSTALMWRALTSPVIHHAAYLLIIAWQVMTTVLLWRGVWRLWRARSGGPEGWNRARNAAILGLTAGALLYGGGFLAVGGEWFAMWQSAQWNGQATAAIFFSFIVLTLLHLAGADDGPPDTRASRPARPS